MENRTARTGRESGQMLVLFVLALAVLMGFMAMVIDVGLIYVERRRLQNAADAAALAGAPALPPEGDAATAIGLAGDFAEKNGYVHGVDDVTIKVETPYNGDYKQIKVTIEKDVPFMFASALGMDDSRVHASAVAVKRDPPEYAIFAHAGNCEKNALNIQGSTSDLVGDIHSNSELKVNSNLYVDGSATHVCTADITDSNTFTEGISQVDQERDWPVIYTYEDFPCTFTDTGKKLQFGKGTPQYFVDGDPKSGVLKPGVYCAEGEIELNESVTGNVTLVAKKSITVTCSACDLTAYWNDVLLFSELSDKGAISLSVNQFYFQGIILAPHGEISASGSTFYSDAGSIIGETVGISASDINVTALPLGEGGPPKLIE